MTHYVFDAIGTHWAIDIYQPLSIQEEADCLSAIKHYIEGYEKTFSRFRKDSIVAAIAANAGTYTMPDYAEALLDIYTDLYKKTHGFFTPLMGGVLADAGYDSDYSLVQKQDLSAPPELDEVLAYTHPELIVHMPVRLDFGAAGKGYLIDLIGRLLEDSFDINTYCIDAGGDILYKNAEPIRIGLENPQDTTQAIGVYTLASGSICGSAGNRRTWANFTHIINPKTLVSPRDIAAVWVVAETALVADALTTCLFFVEADTLSDTYTFEYLIVYKDFSIQKSAGFAAELF